MKTARRTRSRGGPRADPIDVGCRVLAGFAKGREKAICQARERSRKLAVDVLYLARADILAGNPDRGRAGRIARAMHGLVSERHILRILDALVSVSV